jgi:hypothetical protein
MKFLRIFAMTSVVWAAFSINAMADTQAFKCTAEDGKISYLDTRPSTGCVTIEVVRVNVGKGSSVETEDKGGDANAANEDTDKAIAEKKAQIEKECANKKANLQTVKTKAYVQVKDEDGKLKTLSAEELVQMAKEIQGYIDNFCTK